MAGLSSSVREALRNITELESLLDINSGLRDDFEERMEKSETVKSTGDYLNDRRAGTARFERAKAVVYERLDPIRDPALLRSNDGPHEELQSRLTELAQSPGVARADTPALLSATELLAYQSAVSLLQPFDAENLKSSSYEVHAAGIAIYWDTPGAGDQDHATRRRFNVRRGDRLRLPANSIVYVQTEAEFSLPLYIAARFNLRITHVHRGLLLGTGPLVDPGFRGKIFIPLHNLTDTDYWIDTSEALIAVEFTRTSYDRELDRTLREALKADEVSTGKEATAFEERKRRMQPDQYLARANGREPIRSSIGPGIERAQRTADDAQRQVRVLTLGGVIAFAVAFATFMAAVFAAIQAVDGAGEVAALEQRIRDLDELLRGAAVTPPAEGGT